MFVSKHTKIYLKNVSTKSRAHEENEPLRTRSSLRYQKGMMST